MAKPAVERTFVMVKPDGVQRGLIGEIIKRLEQRGLQIIALKMVKPSVEHISNHYPTDEVWIKRLGDKGFNVFNELGIDLKEAMGTADNLEAGKKVRKWLIDYMTEAPVVAMVVEGVHARDMVRKIVGSTLPNKAEIGTLRGDFSVDSPAAANLEKRAIKNLAHASETKEEAEKEICHWFSQEEIHQWDRPDHKAMF
ncbi:MAG: Nucleoside diphosphate kinase [candidate division CPR2 bacterium GW2011_GWC1_39_9]|uniref:nucleoside-diphosphate kinase n=1 Tax=candidate division CPR2 bacterium GW2011_GWC2_39_10 TaxID=1618345 RepID=A0A0G0P5Z2_UNCC2|nr:MAG: Nucleoside diphosphate kinase [candidate division CPR2 bacterium GW2011_GWC2_39_10]KKR35555.1 MAG: Nucleoside diphosphate kinase [candidate division CPR2 bacterium GW2011_GWC1_39_9]